ncbi:MAG TPA: hypothetical protein VLL07_05815 [Pontiella sp.]|nr:hypothetical protein [Pontiella sp.]
MNKKESRRIVPLSAVAVAAFAILIVFQALVIGGVFNLKASTVARIAPWAYEPFLRLVGEHPESETMKGSISNPAEQGTDALSGMASVTDFDPDGLTIDAEAEQGGGTGSGGLMPVDSRTNTVPVESPETNSVPEPSGEVMPVG